MIHLKNRSRAIPLALALSVFAACDGSSKVGELGDGSLRAELLSVEMGRLVDIYSYRRIDESVGDRRVRSNRRLELVEQNVIVNGAIASESLFTQTGAPSVTANYEFMRFDKNVGHEQLVILWDDRDGPEKQAFDNALKLAQTGLGELPASYRKQNTFARPIPIVPRNAALRLNFSKSLDVKDEFFEVNPGAIQVLEFQGDPALVDPADAFRVLPVRVIAKGSSVILDTTILGGEANGGITSPGLPLSADNTTANIRIAIPSRGRVVSSFYVGEDGVAELNGPDSADRPSIIRDFRSGNLADGPAGRLSEPDVPHLVGSIDMGITGVDAANGIITLNKRLHFVPIRGRYPFVDGPLVQDGNQFVGKGPASVPVQRPLRSGDILTQDVVVPLKDGSFETVTLRAEVLENLAVVALDGDPDLGTDPDATDTYKQGGFETTAQVRVATVSPGRDSEGKLVSFKANLEPEGEDCTLRAIYVDDVPFVSGSNRLSDREWSNQFVRIEPSSSTPGVGVSPFASIAIEFTKPMDLDQIDNTRNLLITNEHVAIESFEQQLTDPKVATRRIVPTRMTDLGGDGTVLRLQPPIGFAHREGVVERYSLHVRLGTEGIVDLAGNTVELYDDVSDPQASWSVDFSMDSSAPSNLVAWHVYTFDGSDVDGTLPGSADMFGQFRLEDGRLVAASTVRLSRSANGQTLAAVDRFRRGECWDDANDVHIAPAGHPGRLYWVTQFLDTVAPPNVPAVYDNWQTVSQLVGYVTEPFKSQGSRMQMRYLEDDFSLSYTQPSEFCLDVEQLYWAPFNNQPVLYDVFDRVTMSLAHSRMRPDEKWRLAGDPPACVLECASMNSSLSLTFSENVLQGTSLTPMFEDRIYAINPNSAIQDEGVTFVPYPRFERTYTWRDSRLVTVDASGDIIGLGGAQNPTATYPNNDLTASIDSPWVSSDPDPEFVTLGQTGIWVRDPADFDGQVQRDHDPIALPLLVDFKVFADGAANGDANGTNSFQVATLGPPSAFNNPPAPSPGGYYNAVGAGCPGGVPGWPLVRVHASGGYQTTLGQVEVEVDPANVLTANPVNIVKDTGVYLLPGGDLTTALFTAPPGDGMLHWARADFVRKVSTVTMGFIDTLRPQRYVDANATPPDASDDFPRWDTLDPSLRIADVVVQLDPPQTRQPAGTGVVVELRSAESFDNSNVVYNPTFEGVAGHPASDFVNADPNDPQRGNLLNPNYACEAYRYATGNGANRPAAVGLTRYVTEDKIGLIRDPATGLLGRFMNVRLVMTNNIAVSPALSPSLRSMSVVYRLEQP